MMTLQQRVLATLAHTTSRTPMSTTQVTEVVRRWPATETTLEELRCAMKVGHCRVIKGQIVTDWWWLAGNVLLEDGSKRGRKCK